MKRFINPVPQYFLNDGSIASAGKLYFYENGSTTVLKQIFGDIDGDTELLNPVTLSSEGRVPPIFGEGLFTNRLTDQNGVQQWLRHDCEFSGSDGQFTDYSPVITYGLNDVVRYSGQYWISLASGNRANTPASPSNKWSQILFIEYWNDDKPDGYDENDVVVHEGRLYRSFANGNTTEPPALGWENLTFNNTVTGDLTVSGTISSASLLSCIKTATQSVTSSTTLVDVTDMSLVLLTGIRYHVRAFITWDAGATTANGIKVSFTGAAVNSWIWIANTNNSTANSDPTANASGGLITFTKMPDDSSSSDRVITFDAIVTGTGSAFKMQFAQAVSDSTATEIKSSTCMIATRLN